MDVVQSCLARHSVGCLGNITTGGAPRQPIQSLSREMAGLVGRLRDRQGVEIRLASPCNGGPKARPPIVDSQLSTYLIW